MPFNLENAIAILERTPDTLWALLNDLPDEWIFCTEGDDEWTPFDVIGHLVHGEKTDWIPRVKIILEHSDSVAFKTFDRFAMFEESKGKSLDQLLDEFSKLREQSIDTLQAMNLQPSDFERKGKHPQLGEVNLGQLIATWVTHDLNHIHQIVKTMARQYTNDVGAWREYLNILDD